MTTPNMGLTQPTVLVTTGPTYATQQNTDLDLLDAHDHSSGKGARISQTGLLFSGDLTFANGSSYYGPINVAYMQFRQQTLQSAGTKAASLMADASGNLYYQNGSGINIQLTSGSAIIPNGTGTANGFYGDYASSVAKANFVAAQARYSFYTDNLVTYAKMRGLMFESLSTGTTSGFFGLDAAGANGWQLSNNTGTDFQINFTPLGTSKVGFWMTPGGFNSQYLCGINTPAAPTRALHVNLTNTNPAAVMDQGLFEGRTATGGAPANNFGFRWLYTLATADSTSAATTLAIKEQFTWRNAASTIGRWQLFGCSSGSADGTAAIDATGNGTAGYVGIVTAGVSTNALTVGAIGGVSLATVGSVTIAAGGLTVTAGGATITAGGLTVSASGITVTGNSTITGTLGGLTGLTVASGGAAITGNSTVTGTFTSSGVTTLASGGGTTTISGPLVAVGLSTFSANLAMNSRGTAGSPILYFSEANTGLYSPGANQLGIATNGAAAVTFASSGASTFNAAMTVNSTITSNNTVTGDHFVPSGTASGPVASVGGQYKSNQILAFAEIDSSGTVTSSFGVSSASWSPTGTCTVTFSITPGNCTAIACLDSAAEDKSVALQVNTVSGNTVQVFAWNWSGGTPATANLPFHIFLVGAP